MKSEETPFEGGPLDGRVLPVLLGPTGHPPKVYRVPVPAGPGGPATVLVYRRVPADAGVPPHGRGRARLVLHQGWKYAYDPTGRAGRIRWPWSKPDPRPDGAREATPEGGPDRAPDEAPDGPRDATP